jgi:hypothetical protein
MGEKQARTPRMNHVAMSVPADLLGEEGRREIGDFYSEVFGFQPYDMLTKDREQFVLRAYTNEQFVFLIADDNPMKAPRLDHFGMSVGTKDEFDAFYERAKAYKDRDDRVDLIDPQVDDYEGFLKLHNFYVGFLLPLMVEIQFYDYAQQPT